MSGGWYMLPHTKTPMWFSYDRPDLKKADDPNAPKKEQASKSKDESESK